MCVSKALCVLNVKFLEQKLNYIHFNPCKYEPKLAVNPEDYTHSSAQFYLENKQGVFEVTIFMLQHDINLTLRR